MEDLQDALSAAQRAKRSADSELSEVSDRLQSVELAKMEAENRISTLQKQVSLSLDLNLNFVVVTYHSAVHICVYEPQGK